MRNKVIFLILIFLLFLAYGCATSNTNGKAEEPTQDQVEQPKEDGPIKIGMLVEETGFFAWYGEENLLGARLKAKEINAKGGINGKQIDLIIYNTESNPEKAVIGARKLINDDKVHAIIGLGLISEANAVSPIVAEKGPVTYILSGAYVPKNKYEFGATVFLGNMQRKALSELKKSKNISKVALLSTNDATGQVAIDQLTGLGKELGIEITAKETFNPEDVNVTPQLGRIMRTNPDLIIAWLVGKPMGVVLKNYNQLGLKVPVVTSHGNISQQFLNSIASFQPDELYIPATKDIIWREEFHQNYENEFGKVPGLGSGTGYDALWVLAEAIKAKGTNSEDIISYIENMKEFKGVVATYNFSKDDHRGLSLDEAYLTKVKDGKLIRVE